MDNMKAILLKPNTTDLRLGDLPEPQITMPDQIKMQVLEVGICGTDREQAAGGRAEAAEGKEHLVIGHEMFGRVVAIGESVKAAEVGDYGMFTVRRSCGQCLACLNLRNDMCYTGKYTERGIKGADGFQCQFVVDSETYFVGIPESLKGIGVLTEPMSVAAKAIDEAMIVQGARLNSFTPGTNWLENKKAIIAGIGPIGLMAAFALRLRGAKVVGMDIVDEDTLRPQLLKQIGGIYVDGRKVRTTDLDEVCGEADFVFEATGIAKLQIELLDSLAVNGIYVATGIPGGHRPMTIQAGDIMQQLVLKNQILLGSVNASIAHYKMAVRDLQASVQRWPGVVEQVITERVPYIRFAESLEPHSANEIKVVIDWS
jgi:threonine dehydrogenase-like Zn-dependent dehydrogenase